MLKLVLELWATVTGGAVEAVEQTADHRLKVKTELAQPLTQAQLAAAGLSLEATQEIISAAVVASLNVALGTRATETSLLDAIAKLTDIYNRLGEINTSGSNIAIDADQINLNTDQVEAFLQAIRDRLPVSLGQKLSAEALAVALSTQQEAILASVVAELLNIKARLPELYLERLKISDRLTDPMYLEDKDGTGGVVDFDFPRAPDLTWVTCVGGNGRACYNDVPSASKGAPCDDGIPTPISVSGFTQLKVFADVGTKIKVHGGAYS